MTTGLVSLVFLGGGLADLSGAPAVKATMAQLGYPANVATLLGAWKLLGAAAILAPRLPRLKEWAYAGMFFDLSGAFISHAAANDALPKLLIPLVLLGLVIASWALRPAARKLASDTAHEQHAIGTPALSH